MKIYVVCKNDFPEAAFRSRGAASSYILIQPKRSDGGHYIYWRIHEMKLEDSK